MRITGKELVQKFEAFAPSHLAEEGDPIGLAVGTLDKPVSKMMVTLDVRPEVVAEAIENGVDFIFAHHPPIFRPLKNLTSDIPQNKMFHDLIKHDITVYAAHTNLDITENGMNDWLAEAIGLSDTEVMTETTREYYKKLAVMVPVENAAEVRDALTATGAGQIGTNYVDCSYTIKGTGRFTPIKGAYPTIGDVNEAEEVTELKVEVVVPNRLVKAVEHALIQAHPYEEPAYDLYTIENLYDSFGLGRVGNLAEPMTFIDFAQKMKETFQVDGLRYITGDENQLIQRVAVCGGDGGKFYADALKKQADVYITGDVYYHVGHDMEADGLSVIDPGHHIEQICKPKLVDLFTEWKSELDWDVEIVSSSLNTDPFKFL
ncbi:Nif3-like dinuclear metal center hexameric protein [Desemzia sp. C1]|uniref:Nif3-like dinuclear metal center hexameric protein n=1 Tax=Desemzia sp. C1 TaxID=2892016 RepID=UPI001E2C2D9C|nr:Nif3-like dinuclear metal center hexameric protein [Desemzia sp. C1]MCI3029552.1 Nif3-like dinuclear metal center hexameric protein [Desemzia sp. C1]